VGWLLETGTDPQQLSGRFLGFITVVLKNTRPTIIMGPRKFEENQITGQNTISSFMKTCRFLKGFEITRIDGSLVLIFLPMRFRRRE
jgi:hypothetical protein